SAPIRSTFITACGAGMTAGLIGAYTRSTGTTELATRYLAASPAQQATILQSYLDMVRAFTAHFGIGELLWGTALVLIASVAWSRQEFPRWLVIGLALPGIMAVTQQVAALVAAVDLGFLFFPAEAVLMLAYFGMARRFWSTAPVAQA